MDKKKKYALSITFIFLVALVTVPFILDSGGTGEAVRENRVNEVHIGYLPITASLPLFVAKEKGYFDSQDIEVELVKFESSNLIMDSIIKGELEGSGSVAFNTLFAIEEKFPNQMEVIDSNGETTENFASFVIVKNLSEISEPKNLKGKTLVTGPGLAGRAITETFLGRIGLTLDDVNLIQVKYSLVPSTFIEGSSDAVFIWEPYATIILEKNTGKILVKGPRPKYVLNPYPASASTLSSKFIVENPGVSKRYVLAMDNAVDFIKENPDEARKILIQYTSLSEEIAMKSKLYNYWKNSETNAKGEVQAFADLVFQLGLIKTEVDVGDMIYKIQE